MATSNNDRISSQRLLDTLKGLQASRHLGSEPEVDPQTNEKTKHTIKQDYLPNADWNVNDPDADGYVQGRTHWVEMGITNIRQENPSENMELTSFGVPYGYSSVNDEWYPDFDAVETNFEGFPMYILAINDSDEQITVFNESVLTNAKNYLIVMDYSTMSDVDVDAVAVAKNPISSIRMYGEEVHKLDKKFYDYTEPYDSSKTLTTDNSFDYTKLNRESLNNYIGKNIGFQNCCLQHVTINATQGEGYWKIESFSGSDVDANYKPIQTVANKMNCMLKGIYRPHDILNTLSTAWRIGYSTTNSGQKYYYKSKEERDFTDAVVFENNNDSIKIDVVEENGIKAGFGISGDNLEPLSDVVNNRITLEFYYNTPSVFRENGIRLPIEDGSVTENALANKAVTQDKLNYAVYEWSDTPDEYSTCFSNRYLHNKRVPLIVKPIENNILMPTIVEAPLYSWKFANDNQDVSFEKLCGYIKLAKAGLVGTSGTKHDRTYQVVDINATFKRNMFKDSLSSSTRLYFVDQDDTDGNYINDVQLEYNATYGFGFNIPVVAELMNNDGTWRNDAITVLKGALVGSIESSGYFHFEYISLYDPETGNAWTNNDINFGKMHVKLAFHA